MTARTIPPVPAFTFGMELTSAFMGEISTWMSFWSSPPMMRATQTTTQNLTSGSDTAIQNDILGWDTDSGRAGGSPYGYTIPAGMGGRWRVTVVNAYASNSSGMRVAAARVNGAVPPGRAYVAIPAVSGNLTAVFMSTTIVVNANDLVQPYGYQNSTSVVATYSDATVCSWWEMRLESLASP